LSLSWLLVLVVVAGSPISPFPRTLLLAFRMDQKEPLLESTISRVLSSRFYWESSLVLPYLFFPPLPFERSIGSSGYSRFSGASFSPRSIRTYPPSSCRASFPMPCSLLRPVRGIYHLVLSRLEDPSIGLLLFTAVLPSFPLLLESC